MQFFLRTTRELGFWTELEFIEKHVQEVFFFIRFFCRSSSSSGSIERDPVNILRETGHQYSPSGALQPNSASTLNAQPRIIRNSVLRRTSPISRPTVTTVRVIPNLQKARSSLAGSIASLKPVSSDVSQNNCNNEKYPDAAGRVRVLENSIEQRLSVGEVLRHIRITEQKASHGDRYSGKATGANGASKDEVFFDNSRAAERKLLSQVLEQKEKKLSVRNEMEAAIEHRNQNDQDIDDEVSHIFTLNTTVS